MAHGDIHKEVLEGLNVVENWNSANRFIFFGKGDEVQCVVSENGWLERFSKEGHRALSPLVHAHVDPYGKFELNKDLDLAN